MNDSYLLTVSFLGSAFAGTQRQKDVMTAQGLLERTLGRIYGLDVKIRPCSRLDRGVSAERWYASYDVPLRRFKPDELKYRLNRLLPATMHVREVCEAPNGFDARRQAHLKTYLYTINLGEPDPLRDFLAYVPVFKADAVLLDKYLRLFEGRHDFSSFCGADRPEKLSLIGEVREVGTSFQDGYFRVTFKARAFGRYQVRFMIGAAYEAACGRLDPEQIGKRLTGEIRGRLRYKAPACGLVLQDVDYDFKKEPDNA